MDLALGHPDPDLLPLELMREAAEDRFSQGDPLIIQYGSEKGDEGFREELAAFLAGQAEEHAAAKELFVSGGISQALDLICAVYTSPGDLVITEDPTYFLALKIFRDHGLRMKSVPVDKDGMDVDALEQLLAEETPSLVYTIPSFQNPSGVCMEDGRRRRLSALAERYGFYVVADEAYRLLRYKGEATRAFGDFAEGERVMALGSFSKILGPGLRLGWVRAASRTLHPLVTCGQLDSGGGLNPFTASIVKSALASGSMDRHLEYLRTVYSSRMRRLVGELGEKFGRYGTFSSPSGGYFVWVELENGLSAEKLAEAAAVEKVRFLPGYRCSPGSMGYEPSHNSASSIRLCISFNSEVRLSEGVARLARAAERAGASE